MFIIKNTIIPFLKEKLRYELNLNNKIPEEIYKILIVIVLLIISCIITYIFLLIIKTRIIFVHFFYFPTVFTCIWWKKNGLIVSIFSAFSDSDIGVDDGRKKKIFQRRYSEEKSVHGMGLGLSLIKRIIETYNGKNGSEIELKENI